MLLQAADGHYCVAAWPVEALVKRGATFATSRQFLFTMTASAFRSFATDSMKHCHVQPGQCVWVPYGWSACCVAIGDPDERRTLDTVSCNSMVVLPWFATGIAAQTEPQSSSVMASLIDHLNACRNSVGADTPWWARMVPDLLDWMGLYIANRESGLGSGQQMLTAPLAVATPVIQDGADPNAATPALAAASAVSPTPPVAIEANNEALSSATSSEGLAEGCLAPPNTPITGETLAVRSDQATKVDGEDEEEGSGETDDEEPEEEKALRLASAEEEPFEEPSEKASKASVEASMG